MDNIKKINEIAKYYSSKKFDNRSEQEVEDHMTDWFQKGYLSQEWVDGCVTAIKLGYNVQILYEPDKYYNYLSAYNPKAAN